MTSEPLETRVDFAMNVGVELEADSSIDFDADEDLVVADGLGVEEGYLDDDDSALWEGDKGTIDGRQRDVLISLLKKAFISSDDKAEWRVLTKNPGPIAANLNNLYLKLVIDERSEVAYATPARTADNAFKTLVRDAPNNREETLLLICLRERFRAATAAGEIHVFTDGAAMYDYVQRFRPASATDQLGDERRVANAITGIVTAGLLVRTRDQDRYRVHRAIEALLPLPKLQQLRDAFRAARDDSTPDDTAGYTGKHSANIDTPDAPTEAPADLDDHSEQHANLDPAEQELA